MSSASQASPVTVSSQDLDRLKALYEDGKYLQAYEASKEIGPLQNWVGAEARVFAGRMAYNLGSRKMGRVLHRMAMREHPENHEVIYFFWQSMWPRRGPLAAIEEIERIGDLNDADPVTQTDWFALRGDLYSTMRDFEKADEYLDRAIEMQPDRAWLHVIRAENLKNQDKIDEAIEASEYALKLRPWYRPALQNLANRYVQANRDEEAFELLKQGIERIESGDVRIQLAALHLELEQYEEAGKLYDSLDKYFPVIDYSKNRQKWIAAMRADVAYNLGDLDTAAKLARQADERLFKEFAERLEDRSIERKRVQLPVKFVRQNHITCAPATLTSISNYWEMPAEHLDVVEKICYDGTPAHSERRWAGEHGFIAREFKVTWESATALLDKGIPFTLTTVEPGSAHLQAIFGYDVHRKSFLIRDPGERHYAEAFAEKMLERYASTGPRGMVMVPEAKADLLAGIELPDAEIYDEYHQLEVHFDGHDRDAAVAVLEKLQAIAPEHRLALRAEGLLARYDNDLQAQLDSNERLLKQFPEDVNYQLIKLSCLRELGRRDERIAMLRETMKQDECDPMFWGQLASELSEDARQHDEVVDLYRRMVRYRPHEGSALSGLATIYMDLGKKTEAVRLFRFAACVEDRKEYFAKMYFHAARTVNETETAFRYLRDRVERFGNMSSMPARTLSWAYDNTEQTKQALQVIKTSFQHHKEDGDFLLYAAEFFARYGKFDKTEELLKRAKGHSHPMDWLQNAALIATYQGETETALKHWKEIVDQDPLNFSAQSSVAELIADTQGTDAAIEHLRQSTERFPNSYSTRMGLIEWMREKPNDDRLRELGEFLKFHPSDAWAMRERAMVLTMMGKYDDAQKDADAAYEIDPTHSAALYIKGALAEKQGDRNAAMQHYMKCLEISIDYEMGIVGLIGLCNSKTERVKALKFVYKQLVEQVSLGEGWLTFSKFAQSSLEPEELLTMLKKAVQDRPDLWHAWSALTRQYSDMQKHEDAIKVATDATKKFPLLPRVWMDLSAAHASVGQIDEEIEALQRAKNINPTWGAPARMISEALEKKGDLQAAKKEIEQVIRFEPRNVVNLGHLASLQWTLEEKEDALQTVAKAVRLEPGYDWGWNALRSWCEQLGKPDFDVEVAQELVNERPDEARSWLVMARCLDQDHQVEQSIEAVDKAIVLNPRSVEAYSIKSVMLCRMGEYDAAVAAANPVIFGDDLPIELRARAAWIEGERGDFDAAIRTMEQVVEIDPDYFWAWHRLADWYDYQELHQKYRAASEQMIRIEPQNPVPWGYIGDGELRNGNREEAKKYFRQAVQIAPSYTYASGQMMEMLLEDEEFDEAHAVIDLITPHIPSEWVLSEKGRVFTLQRQQPQAIEQLKQLCVTPADGAGAIDGLVEEMFKAGWSEKTLGVINASLDDPNVEPGAAYVFVNLAATLEKWDYCETRLVGLKSNEKIWKSGIGKLVNELGNAGEIDRMKRLINVHQQEFKQDTALWEDVGSAYSNAGLDQEAITWMTGWERRHGITGKGLFHLACSMWDVKQDRKAGEVSKYALMHLEPDNSNPMHRVLFAKHEMIYGDIETSASLLREIDPMSLSAYYRFEWEFMISILLSASEGESHAQLKERLDATWNQLSDEAKQTPLQRTYGLYCWKAADLHNKWFKKLFLKKHLA